MSKNYVTPREATRILGVSERTLRRWEEIGKIETIRTSAVKEDTTSQAIQLSLDLAIELPSSTLASLLQNSEKTLLVNVRISSLDTLKQKLLQKSAEGSITKEKNYLPYWNELCQGMSSALWSSIKTASPDSVLTYLPGSVPNTLVNSWFSTKLSYLQNERWLKTCWPSSTVLAPVCTDSGNIKLKSSKIRIYPDQSLHQTWKKWLAASRYCFNEAIAYQRKHGSISKYKLRPIILENVPDWVKECPYSFRVQAVYDACQAFGDSWKKGTPQDKAGRFRSCKDRIQSIQFRQEDYKKGTWFPDMTKGMTFHPSEPMPVKDVSYQQKQKNGTYKTLTRTKSWDSETQLVYDKKRWFAVFPVEFSPTVNQSEKIIALDPGVRTFLTGFDGERFLEIGRKDITRIYRLCRHTDNLISQKTKLKGRKLKRQRHKTQRRIDALLIRIRNLIDEVHKKAAKYLTTEYKLIFLPTFESSQMVAKKKDNDERRKINSKTVRQMLSWSHFRFKQTLKFQALKRGCHVVDVTEEYTSKTCSRCGHVHTKLGGSKMFKCPHCGHRLDRDFNGALGIFFKALRDIAFVASDSVTVTVLCRDSSNIVRA